MVLKLSLIGAHLIKLFENDVKEYGTQASKTPKTRPSRFENDVKEYGTQAKFMREWSAM